jgi:small subunit ribosomal protein S2
MRAIQLYALGIAEAVLEGKQAIPEVPAGEDEFVELDEEGMPKKKMARRKPAPPRRKAAIRRKPPVKTLAPQAPSSEPSTEAAAPTEAAPAATAELEELDDDTSDGDVAAVAGERFAARRRAPAGRRKPGAKPEGTGGTGGAGAP